MTPQTPEILQQFKPSKIIWPILIGISAAGLLIWNNFQPEAFESVNWTWTTTIWIITAVFMMAIRDLAYMYRIRLLTNWKLSFNRSFVVIMLWEFASAVTPSIVGGTAFAFLLLTRENVSLGRTTAIVLLTAFLDELFFVLSVPLMLAIIGYGRMFSFLDSLDGGSGLLGIGIAGLFWLGYLVLFLYTAILAYGLFVNPKALRNLLWTIFRIRFLRKWRAEAKKGGKDILVASKELKGQTLGFWAKAFGSTVFSWTARYMVINCILAAFAISVTPDHFLIYARQIFMWVIMLITPTPGGAGGAELVFGQFLSDYIEPGLGGALGLLWRLISYYPYLIIGAIVLPRWLNNKFKKPKIPKIPTGKGTAKEE